jgi:hypothetical protein
MFMSVLSIAQFLYKTIIYYHNLLAMHVYNLKSYIATINTINSMRHICSLKRWLMNSMRHICRLKRCSTT